MSSVFIYTLNCPITGAVRYVGKTENSVKRYRQHLFSKEKNHRGCWIESLRIRGLKPEMRIVDETPYDFWPSLEAAYIQFFRDENCDLLNGTEGGEDPPHTRGVKRPLETGARISAALTGRKLSPEHCEAIGKAKRGKIWSLEQRAKLVGRPGPNLGRKFSPEHCAALRVAHLGEKHSLERCINKSISMLGEKNCNFGKKMSAEQKEKISATKRGKKHSLEHCAKISASNKLRWEKKKGIEYGRD